MRAAFLVLALTVPWLAGCCGEAESAPAATAQTAPAAAVAQPGSFQLADTNGQVVTEASLLGKPSAFYFGYTSDAGSARAVLANFASAVGAMGSASGRLNVAFVSLDPERDTPE